MAVATVPEGLTWMVALITVVCCGLKTTKQLSDVVFPMSMLAPARMSLANRPVNWAPRKLLTVVCSPKFFACDTTFVTLLRLAAEMS